jgi:hypothetical protein
MKDLNLDNIDISLLAIHAADELARKKEGLRTSLKSVRLLATLLQTSFSEKVQDYRFDHLSVVDDALSNSLGIPQSGKTLSEIAADAYKIATQLNPDSFQERMDNLDKLISFCISLSKSAALYRSEQEELFNYLA